MKYIFLLISLLLLTGCGDSEVLNASSMEETAYQARTKALPQFSKPEIDVASFNRTPNEWGERVTGVKTHFATNEKEIALTFDLCGGEYGSGYDATLVEFLRTEQVAATIFVNERWIAENEVLFLELAADPLFQIENHGTAHAPLSVNGKEAWGIAGTNSAEEAAAEMMGNHEKVKELTGREMKFFRSGTAFYDEIAVELANALGYEVVNFDILGDAGATYSAAQVERALLQSKPGSIALLHMNQPRSGTAQGVKAAVPKLRAEGFDFVHLDEKELQ